MISNNAARVGGKAGNKAACFERGNTDRFKAEFPIWKPKKNWTNDNPTHNPILPTKGGEQMRKKEEEGEVDAKSVKFTCLGMNECGPVVEETPGNDVNAATREIF